MNIPILLIDDEKNLRELMARILNLEGYNVYTAPTIHEAKSFLERNPFPIIITDVKLPDGDGVDFTKYIKHNYPESEVIVITAYGNIQDGVKAMKNGANDYLVKGGDGDEVILSVKKALEKIELKKELEYFKQKATKDSGFNSIISGSPKIKECIELAQKVAPTDSSVLLLGETGTGKELFAKAIHLASPRKDKPFIAINCSAITKDLQESELFGYVKGAFTGAGRDKKGYFEEADKGTLFLDEVGDMSLETQAKLLRFLEDKTFTRVGDTKPISVDVRIISATNANLSDKIKTGDFRDDLYYRLNEFNITLPSLRERKEDIEVLAKHFASNSQKLKKTIEVIEPDFITSLKGYNWPGNIRELKNVVERAVILSDNNTLSANLLPKGFFNETLTEDLLTLNEIEKRHILKIYEQSNHNKTLTAQLLDIGLATLHRKLKEYGIS